MESDEEYCRDCCFVSGRRGNTICGYMRFFKKRSQHEEYHTLLGDLLNEDNIYSIFNKLIMKTRGYRTSVEMLQVPTLLRPADVRLPIGKSV